MVDFNQLRSKAEELLGEHSDKVKTGIDKIGDVVGRKVGHDKADPIEQKLHGFVDKVAADRAATNAVVDPVATTSDPVPLSPPEAPEPSAPSPVEPTPPGPNTVPDPTAPPAPAAPSDVPGAPSVPDVPASEPGLRR